MVLQFTQVSQKSVSRLRLLRFAAKVLGVIPEHVNYAAPLWAMVATQGEGWCWDPVDPNPLNLPRQPSAFCEMSSSILRYICIYFEMKLQFSSHFGLHVKIPSTLSKFTIPETLSIPPPSLPLLVNLLLVAIRGCPNVQPEPQILENIPSFFPALLFHETSRKPLMDVLSLPGVRGRCAADFWSALALTWDGNFPGHPLQSEMAAQGAREVLMRVRQNLTPGNSRIDKERKILEKFAQVGKFGEISFESLLCEMLDVPHLSDFSLKISQEDPKTPQDSHNQLSHTPFQAPSDYVDEGMTEAELNALHLNPMKGVAKKIFTRRIEFLLIYGVGLRYLARTPAETASPAFYCIQSAIKSAMHHIELKLLENSPENSGPTFTPPVVLWGPGGPQLTTSMQEHTDAVVKAVGKPRPPGFVFVPVLRVLEGVGRREISEEISGELVKLWEWMLKPEFFKSFPTEVVMLLQKFSQNFPRALCASLPVQSVLALIQYSLSSLFPFADLRDLELLGSVFYVWKHEWKPQLHKNFPPIWRQKMIHNYWALSVWQRQFVHFGQRNGTAKIPQEILVEILGLSLELEKQDGNFGSFLARTVDEISFEKLCVLFSLGLGSDQVRESLSLLYYALLNRL
jgi:hypothetical protein